MHDGSFSHDQQCRLVEDEKEDKKDNVKEAMATLSEAVKGDPEYAWSWHCNLVMSACDEGLNKPAANRSAARFMIMAFDVDMTEHEHFADTQDNFKAEQEDQFRDCRVKLIDGEVIAFKGKLRFRTDEWYCYEKSNGDVMQFKKEHIVYVTERVKS